MSHIPVSDGTDSSSQTETSKDGSVVLITDRVRHEIENALRLLTYAVEVGHVNPTTKETLSDDLIETIRSIAAKAGITMAASVTGTDISTSAITHLDISDWTQFETAYYKLARFMSPITAQTLADTEGAGRGILSMHSPVQIFTKYIWAISILYAVFIVLGEWGLTRYAPVQEGEVDGWNTLMQLVQILVPYAYGGLGACAFLLRSAHSYIHERTFDVRKRPEYFSRIVLGTVSGGAIILFVNSVTDTGGSTITLSSAALGFIGGYSTDFLFNAIERVVGALLPKIGIQSIKQGTTAVKPPLDLTSGGLTLKELLERYAQAADPDKAMYKGLIEKLKDRL